MFKQLFMVFSTIVLLSATSAQAQPYGAAPSPQHYRCTPDGKPATPGTGWCKRNDAPTSTVAASAPTAPSVPPVAQQGAVPAPVVLNQGDLEELRRQYQLDKTALRPAASPAPVAAPAVRAPASSGRVFTADVSIEALAGAFKAGAKSDVLNAPAEDVALKIQMVSNVNVTPQLLFAGNLVECQDVGVKGKQRIGLKQGTKEFVAAGAVFEKCQPGQKLYVVKDHNDKNVAIADNSGFLLGTVAPDIKIDR